MKSAFFLKKLLPIAAVIILLSTVSLFAQQTIHLEYLEVGQFIKVELKDGNTVEGRVNEVSENTLVLKLSIGQLKLHRTDIKNITLFDEETQKELNQKYKLSEEYAISKIAGTKGIIFPTAYPLAKGKAYYQNSYIFVNMFGYGLTNNISISGGFEAVTTFSTFTEPIILLSPKVRFKLTENLYVGAWTFLLLFDGYTNYTTLAMLTYGNKDNNITFSSNLPIDGISNLETNDNSFRHSYILSGQVKINRKVSLVSDNIVLEDNQPEYKGTYNTLFIVGLRIKRETSSFDFALFTTNDSEGVILPYVSYTLGF